MNILRGIANLLFVFQPAHDNRGETLNCVRFLNLTLSLNFSFWARTIHSGIIQDDRVGWCLPCL